MKLIRKIFKVLYLLIPFKQGLFSIFKRFWIPPKSIYKFLTFEGILKVSTSAGTTFKIKSYGDSIENEIFWSSLKNWEHVSIGIWSVLCKSSEVIFDVGANTGIYSLIAKSINPKAAVYAFEPVARVYKKLASNNSLNNFDISCNEIALSNYEGDATLYDVDSKHVYTAFVNKNHFDPSIKTIEVKITASTLNSFIRLKNIQKIDLMKIDVELHEVEVMEGFSEYLEKFKPTILIEILNDEIGNKIQQLVSRLNYMFFNVDESKGIRQVENIGKSDHFNYLLCTKETVEKHALLKLFLSAQKN